MPRQLLYWMDQGTKTISRVNFEGHHRKTVVESNGYLDEPFGLAVFEVRQHGDTVVAPENAHQPQKESAPSVSHTESVCCRVLCTGAKR